MLLLLSCYLSLCSSICSSFSSTCSCPSPSSSATYFVFTALSFAPLSAILSFLYSLLHAPPAPPPPHLLPDLLFSNLFLAVFLFAPLQSKILYHLCLNLPPLSPLALRSTNSPSLPSVRRFEPVRVIDQILCNFLQKFRRERNSSRGKKPPKNVDVLNHVSSVAQAEDDCGLD